MYRIMCLIMCVFGCILSVFVCNLRYYSCIIYVFWYFLSLLRNSHRYAGYLYHVCLYHVLIYPLSIPPFPTSFIQYHTYPYTKNKIYTLPFTTYHLLRNPSLLLLPTLKTRLYLACKRIICEHLPRRAGHALTGQDGKSMRCICSRPFREVWRVVCRTARRGNAIRAVETRANF